MKSGKYVSMFIGVIFFSLALWQTAGAAIRPSVLTLSPMVGVHLFSSDQNLKDAPLYGLGIGYNFTERFATEVILSYVPTKTDSGVKDDVDYTSLRLDLLYHFPLSGHLVPYLALGAGEAFVSPDKIASDKNVIVGYGAGAKYFINDALAVRCDVRHLLDINDVDTQRRNTVLNNFSVNAGIFLQFGGREEKVLVAKSPEKITDRDQDGIADNLDLCPDTAAGVAVNEKGCPVVTDKDRDGVIDAQDVCPNTPAGTVVDARGCPAQVTLVTPLPEPALTFHLEYLPNESEVRNDFAAEMQKMADFIKANPGKRFIIEGHTDSVGSDASNMRLSLLRAEKIKAYLSEKMGISASLLEARGFGEGNPVADNNTQEGRQQNRRVVIIAFPQL
jgi:OOP family OmpA-OmpF porin